MLTDYYKNYMQLPSSLDPHHHRKVLDDYVCVENLIRLYNKLKTIEYLPD